MKNENIRKDMEELIVLSKQVAKPYFLVSIFLSVLLAISIFYNAKQFNALAKKQTVINLVADENHSSDINQEIGD